MDEIAELDRTLARVEAFFERLPRRPNDHTVLEPASAVAVQAIADACGRPLPAQLAHLHRRGLRVATVAFDPEDVWDDEDVHAEGFSRAHEPGFGGLEVLWSAADVVTRVARDRELAREIDQPELLDSVVVFQVRPHHRVRLADGAVLFATDDHIVELAPSLTAFFDAWLAIGCFLSHDYRTYAGGLSRLTDWRPPAPGSSSLLRAHDAIFRTSFHGAAL